MDRLFTMDEEDKINLEVETPSATSKDSIEEGNEPKLDTTHKGKWRR